MFRQHNAGEDLQQATSVAFYALQFQILGLILILRNGAPEVVAVE